MGAIILKNLLVLLFFLSFIPIALAEKNIRADGSDSLNFQTGGKNTRVHIDSAGLTFFDTMTADNVPYFGAAGELKESSLFTFNGSDLVYPMADGVINVGNGANQKAEVTLSGDASMTNTGVLTLTPLIIDNADVSASAALDRSKIASGTINHVIINDGSGVFSSEALLDKTRGGTGISSTATFPASGTVVTEAGVQALTLKDYDISSVAQSDTNRLTLGQDTTTNLDLLTDKKGTLAYDTTLDTLVVNDGTDWVEISGSGGSSPSVAFTASETNTALTTVAINTNIPMSDIAADIGGNWDAVNDYYVVPETGEYLVTAGHNFTNMDYGFAYYARVLRNGSLLNAYFIVNYRFKLTITGGAQDLGGFPGPSGVVTLTAGDTIALQSNNRVFDASESGSVRSFLSITKVSNGGGTTLKSVSIAESTAAQLVTAAGTDFIAGTEIKDTDSLYDHTTGEFTCNRDGTLTVSSVSRTQSTNLSTSQLIASNLYKNAVIITRMDLEKGNGVSLEHLVSATVIVDCITNDVFKVGLSSSINLNLTANALDNRLSFILE